MTVGPPRTKPALGSIRYILAHAVFRKTCRADFINSSVLEVAGQKKRPGFPDRPTKIRGEAQDSAMFMRLG